LDQVVPPAAAADLKHVDTNLSVLMSHRFDFRPGLDATGELAELVTENVGEMSQLRLATHGARRLNPLPVVLGRS
jgi:hypothetical protein